MVAPLRILIDVRPRLLADAIALVVHEAGVSVEFVEGDIGHDDHPCDLAVIDDEVRAPRPALVTARVRPDDEDALSVVLDLIRWLSDRSTAPGRQAEVGPQPAVTPDRDDPSRAGAPARPPPAGC
jgi:hypothetical protein